MKLSEWKDLADTVSGFATAAGLVMAGLWSYILFVKNREKFPRAEISHQAEMLALTSNIRIVRVAITIKNEGKVLLAVGELECRLLQVLPITGSLAMRMSDPQSLIDANATKVAWPMLDQRTWKFEGGDAELEPGESETLRCDFVAPMAITVMQVYSHLRNPVKPKIGWTFLSQIVVNGTEK